MNDWVTPPAGFHCKNCRLKGGLLSNPSCPNWRLAEHQDSMRECVSYCLYLQHLDGDELLDSLFSAENFGKNLEEARKWAERMKKPGGKT
jgi:hypothetical protein